MPPQADPFAEFRVPAAPPAAPRTSGDGSDPFAEFRVAKAPPQTPKKPIRPGDYDPEKSLTADYERFKQTLPTWVRNAPGATIADWVIKHNTGAVDWLIENGPQAVKQGLRDMKGELDTKSLKDANLARGGRQALGGAFVTGMGMLAPELGEAFAVAPAATTASTLLGIGTGAVVQPVAEAIGEKVVDSRIGKDLGLHPEAAGLMGDAASLAAGFGTERVLRKNMIPAAQNAVAGWKEAKRADLQKKLQLAALGPHDVTIADRAMPHVEHFTQGPHGETPADLVTQLDATRDGMEAIATNAKRAFPGHQIKTDPRAAAASALQKSKQGPGYLQRGLAWLDDKFPQLKGQKPTFEEADDIRRELNKLLEPHLAANKYDQNSTRINSPEYAAGEAALNSLKDGYYDGLEDLGVAGMRKLRQDEGAVLELRNLAQRYIYRGHENRRVEVPGALRRALNWGLSHAAAGVVGATGVPGAGGMARTAAQSALGASGSMTREAMLAKALELRKPSATPRYPVVPNAVQPPPPRPAPPAPAPRPVPAAPTPAPAPAPAPATPQRPPGTPYSPFTPAQPVNPRVNLYGPEGPFGARQPVPPQGKLRPVADPAAAPAPVPAAQGIPAPPNPARVTLKDQVERARVIAVENPDMDGAEAMRLAKEQWPLTESAPAPRPARPAAAVDPEAALTERLRAAGVPEADIEAFIASRQGRAAAAAPVQAEPIPETPAPAPAVETPPVPKAPAELVDEVIGQQLMAVSPERRAIAEKMVGELEYDPAEAVAAAVKMSDEDVAAIVKEMAGEAAAGAVHESPEPTQPAGNAVTPPPAPAGKKKIPRR